MILHFDSYLSEYLALLLPHTSTFNSILSPLSLLPITILIWLIFEGFFIIKGRFTKLHYRFLSSFVISYSVTGIFVNFILKNIFMRSRPWVGLDLPQGICPSDFSFPSGHAAEAFAGAVIFAHFDRKRKWFYYSIAIGISYSRIYLYCHYFLDVIFGALIGAMISIVVLRIVSWRIKLQAV